MAALNSQVFFPASFQDLFAVWNRYPDAVIYSGGSEFIRKQVMYVPTLPQNIISLEDMEELKKISRTERYLEIGAMVRMNQIIQLGKIVPEPLILCLEGIDGPQLRNLATIGGNLCYPSRRLDASAPMIALDALFELRTALSSRWISASRFSSLPGPPALAHHEILTRIRVPLEPWTFTWYRKFRSYGSDEPGGGMLFMIRNEKDILTRIRAVYSGKTILREKNSETMLEGKHLPLDRSDAVNFVAKWETYLSLFEGNEASLFPGEEKTLSYELMKAQILNFIETTLFHITD